jgi:hypothetical protein
LEPAVAVIRANQGERAAWIELVHAGGGPIAIEVKVFERALDLDGVLVREAMVPSAEVLAHPSEVILYPNERATVQLLLRGTERITADRAYTIVTTEAPIPIEEEGTGVRIGVTTLMSYMSVISVETGRPGNLAFVSSRVLGDGLVEVIAVNRGSGRVPLRDIGIRVGGQRIEGFTGGGSSIMPGQQRRFTFQHPRAPTAREVSFGSW